MTIKFCSMALVTVGLLSGCGLFGSGSSNSNSSSSSSSGSGSSSSGSSSSGGSETSINTDVDIPKEYRFSEDGKRLDMGGFYSSKLYSDETIESIYLEFSQPDYLTQLTDNYADKVEIEATLTYKDKIYPGVGVRYRGLTSYALAGDKKSFSIDLEWATDGQDINGYNELKLNNAAEDPSGMREVLYSKLARDNIPSAKANFINLYINGENYGVYSNVQKLEKDHAKEWFFDKEVTRWRAEDPNSTFSIPIGGEGFPGGGEGFPGGETDCTIEEIESGDCCPIELADDGSCPIDFAGGPGGGEGGPGGGEGGPGGEGGFGGGFGEGTSSLNDLGEDGASYENAYTLKYASVEDPWQNLANACNTMGVTSPEYIVEELGKYLDIDSALWFLATENVFGDDDSYISKGGMDYYVYFDVFTGRILPIEYDGNSALKASNYDPFKNATNESYPLLSVLLNVPELRQRYLAHYRTIMQESLDSSAANDIIDRYLALVEPYQAVEAVRNYSYDEFVSGVTSLKEFFTQRESFLAANQELSQKGVEISSVNHSVGGQAEVRPSESEQVKVVANTTVSAAAAYLYYGTGLAGLFAKLEMSVSSDGKSFEGIIPAQLKGVYVRYYVEVIANDSVSTATYSPVGAEHDVYIYQVLSAEYSDSVVVINELMPANKAAVANSEGEYEDWIELYNTSSEAVDLSGYYLTDQENKLDKWAFPDSTIIAANGTLIVWADEIEESTGGLHSNFKLSQDGERVFLVTPEKGIVDEVIYEAAEDDSSYGRSPNGTGSFDWLDTVTFDTAN